MTNTHAKSAAAKAATRLGLIAGLILTALFPLALLDIHQPAFQLVWGIHLCCQIAALLYTVSWLLSLPRKNSSTTALAWTTIALGLIAAATLCLLPIISRDALIYHLAVPELWLQQGKIYEINWHQWSYFPLLTSLGYAGFLAQGWGSLTPFYHLSFLILLAGQIAIFVKHHLQNNDLTLFSFALVISTPLCLKLAAEPMADLSLAYYFFSACALLLSSPTALGFRTTLGAGLFLGLALSTKYNAILAAVVFIPLFFVYRLMSNVSKRQGITECLLVGISSLLVLSPWLLKNYFWTSNPVYPFLGSWFRTGDPLPFFGQLRPIPYRIEVYGENFIQFLLIPLRVLFFGEDDNPQLFDGRLTPLFLLATVPIFYYKKLGLNLLVKLLLAFCIAYVLSSLSLFYALVRYQVPIIGFVVFLSCLGITQVASSLHSRWRPALIPVLLATQLFLTCTYLWNKNNQVELWPYLAGQLNQEAYLNRHSSEYGLACLLNRLLPTNTKTLLINTGNRFYLYDRPVEGHYFSLAPIKRYWQGNPTPERLSHYFSENDFTHIALHVTRTARLLRDSQDPFTQMFLQFLASGTIKLAQHGPYEVLRINPEHPTTSDNTRGYNKARALTKNNGTETGGI